MRTPLLSLVANLVFSVLFVLVTLELLAATGHKDLSGWPLVGNWVGTWPTAAWKYLFLVSLLSVFSLGAVLRFPNLLDLAEQVSQYLRDSPGEESRLAILTSFALLSLRILVVTSLIVSPIVLIGAWYFLFLEVDTERLNGFQVLYSILAYVFYLFYVWLQRRAEN